VGQPRAFQRQLPVGAHRCQPSLVIGILGAEQDAADRAEQVMPRRRAGLAVRPEPPKHPEAHERG
jgi:hypothetical protein